MGITASFLAWLTTPPDLLPSTSQRKPPTLQTIPAELRLQIYSHLFTGATLELAPDQSSNPIAPPALARTCSLFRNEVPSAYYSHVWLRLTGFQPTDSPAVLSQQLARISDADFRDIRRFELELNNGKTTEIRLSHRLARDLRLPRMVFECYQIRPTVKFNRRDSLTPFRLSSPPSLPVSYSPERTPLTTTSVIQPVPLSNTKQNLSQNASRPPARLDSAAHATRISSKPPPPKMRRTPLPSVCHPSAFALGAKVFVNVHAAAKRGYGIDVRESCRLQARGICEEVEEWVLGRLESPGIMNGNHGNGLCLTKDEVVRIVGRK